MNDNHQAHLAQIISSFGFLVTGKYEQGVAEHGGNLWEKDGLLDMAIDEAIDQVVYLLTLKQQLENQNE